MLHIWLIRHGKSRNPGFNQRDHERELAPRGHEDGERMAAWLEQQPNRPQWIWASSAVRAQQTAAYVSHASGTGVITEEPLYLSNPEAVVGCLQATPPDITSACVVAHNPGLTALTNLWAARLVTDNLPTWGCAHFTHPGEWTELSLQTLNLVEWTTPKLRKGA